MSFFSKNRSYLAHVSNELTYEIIYRIASMRIIDKMKPFEIAKELELPYSHVIGMIQGKKQNAQWIDAIADLARKGLIDG